MAALRPSLREVDVLVLNGDTFDFRWSGLPHHEATIAAAIAWLEALLHDWPHGRVHFVLGNHDCLAPFERRLHDLAGAHARFAWHPELLRLGDAVFLHGDCAQRPMDAHGLAQYRAAWRADRQRGRATAAAYAWADRTGLTRLIHRWHFAPRPTVARIASYLDHAAPGWRSHTRHCYFGHTHVCLSDYLHEGVRFHNTGSAIRGMEFRPRSFTIPEAGGAGHRGG